MEKVSNEPEIKKKKMEKKRKRTELTEQQKVKMRMPCAPLFGMKRNKKHFKL